MEEKTIDTEKTTIKFRIDKIQKNDWKNLCNKRNISITSLIVDSVENRIQDDERRKILEFIEQQDNIFVKIETNINQIAKIANAQKLMNVMEMQDFSSKLSMIVELKKKQNEIFHQIYSMLGK